MRTPQFDLVIVGAGLAGLAAGRRAAELGLNFELFEASDGVGGRVRSDRVGEYICDRGFQLINPSYPALSRYFAPERFHTLERGIDLSVDGRVLRLGDPIRDLASISGDLSPKSGTLTEKLRFLRYLISISRGEFRDDLDDRSFEEEMLSKGIGRFYARVLGPFAAGVFLNHPSKVSARVARELIHYFMVGEPGLPVGGVGEVSKELAQGLPINLRSRVDEVIENGIRIGRRRIKAKAVIVATDAITTSSLINDLNAGKRVIAREMSASTTWYHALAHQELPARLRIDGSGNGPITNTIAISSLAPEYAPPGKSLISTTVMSAYGQEVSEARVRRHLAELWNQSTDSWELVSKYSIPKSLPLMPPGVGRETSLLLARKKGASLRVVAGDFLNLPAQQGAMESGIDAAEQIASNI